MPLAHSPTPPRLFLPAKPSFPNPTAYAWQLVAQGLSKPVGITNAGDGSNRLFVIEQSGLLRIVKDGRLLRAPFLDIRDRVGSQGSEQGLLGLAFHPQYRTNGYFYVNYTDRNGDTHIARFSVSRNDADRADPASEQQLMLIHQPFPNHNGGEVAFGADGFLYLGLGDGGSGGDPLGNAQSLQSLLGKILRIDINQGNPYAIPADNPFASGGGLPEIWVYGLRNPWRFSFDRLTGDLYIGDVGQNKWEEIDFLAAGKPGGENFGWNYFEGTHPYKDTPPKGFSMTPPIAEYGHELGCSVTGGVVYRGRQYPEWESVYLYGDFCSGTVWGLKRDSQEVWQNFILFQHAGQITSFGEDESGEVYLADYGGGIYSLVKKP
jgi:glucose/arabinose dehydrogenase